MGTLAFRAGPTKRSLILLALSGLLALPSACDTKSNKHRVSPSLFLAPIRDQGAGDDNGLTVRAERLDFLLEIKPGTLPSDLVDTPTEPFVLGRMSVRDPATGDVEEGENLLVYEANSSAVLSVNLCLDPAFARCGKVRLHYDKKGLDLVEGQGGGISTSVTPIKLRNGWILAFDSRSKSIVAFREEKPRTVVGDDGQPQRLEYRSPVDPSGQFNKDSDNFGLGNGVLLSVVVSGEAMAQQLLVPSEPIVSRLFEIEKDKILVFFTSAVTRAVHLLELSEVEETVSYDLDDRTNPAKRFPVKFLRGTFKLFAETLGGKPNQPFLPLSTVSLRITGTAEVSLDTFQPILVPDDVSPTALVYDRRTSTFIRVGLAKQGGEIVGSTLGLAVRPELLLGTLAGGATGQLVDPPLDMSGGFYNPSTKKTEIFIVEEKTNNILAYDYTQSLDRNLRVFVPSSNILLRRDPSGQTGFDSSAEPVLDIAIADVRANRLAFDQGLDQLLGISYTSGVVTIVATKQSIADVTGNPLSELTYIEPIDENRVRAFDALSSSLIEIRLDYAAIPIRVR
ncbi:MAG: hypothetical protein HY721_07155 [Planctomycetes bacterium]|nr:hypothetical protein [Planctomycetota bacterium]